MFLILGIAVVITTGNGESFEGVYLQNMDSLLKPPVFFVEANKNPDFPIPEDAINYSQQPTPGVGGSVNFQTQLSLTEAIEFYRKQLKEQGLTERDLNTAITDTTFSLVFDGAKNGLAVVVQGIELGTQRNINIRYEKLDSENH